MSDEEDYLSDKFLVDTAAFVDAPKTYAERRREAERESAIKNEQNRRKSRRQVELEAREEGLSKSLFERAQEEAAAGEGPGNKALSMMMKMGFKPGQSLGKVEDEPERPPSTERETSLDDGGQPGSSRNSETPEASSIPDTKPRHAINPLPINEWAGKQGLGVRKRARSPSVTERTAKMAKMEEDSSRETFRDRARQDYEERRAEGRLRPAQRTCITLDEKDEKKYNVLWLDPHDSESFPPGLMDALVAHNYKLPQPDRRGPHGESAKTRLRNQMQADASQPLSELDDETASRKPELVEQTYSEEDILEAVQFLRLNARDRLFLVLTYLRDKYAYCFWCGSQYDDAQAMEEQCPGSDEDAHD